MSSRRLAILYVWVWHGVCERLEDGAEAVRISDGEGDHRGDPGSSEASLSGAVGPCSVEVGFGPCGLLFFGFVAGSGERCSEHSGEGDGTGVNAAKNEGMALRLKDIGQSRAMEMFETE